MATMFGGPPVEAATVVENLVVSATVDPACEISTAPVNFGNYDALNGHDVNPLDTTGEVRITCANGLPVLVRLGQSLVPVAGTTEAAPLREMTGPGAGDVLTYNLYTDAAHSVVWGNTVGTGVPDTGSGVLETLIVYGRIPAGQVATPGAYGDTVVASVDF